MTRQVSKFWREGTGGAGRLTGYWRRRLQTLCGLILLFSAPSLAGQADMNHPEFPGTGPFSRMSMTLFRSLLFLRVDVVHLDVQFGLETTNRLEALAGGRNLTPGLADSIAEIATHSQDAYVRLRFLRNLDLDQFIKEARQNTKLVYQEGLITKNAYQEIARDLPFWYSSLKERGIKTDDLMLCRVHGDGLRTIYRGSDGKVYLDREGYGEEQRLAVLGGYFVSKSQFRDSLIRSLFLVSPDQRSEQFPR